MARITLYYWIAHISSIIQSVYIIAIMPQQCCEYTLLCVTTKHMFYRRVWINFFVLYALENTCRQAEEEDIYGMCKVSFEQTSFCSWWVTLLSWLEWEVHFTGEAREGRIKARWWSNDKVTRTNEEPLVE